MTYHLTTTVSLQDIRNPRETKEAFLRALVLYEEMDLEIEADITPGRAAVLYPNDYAAPAESAEVTSMKLHIHDPGAEEDIEVPWEDLLDAVQTKIEEELFEQLKEPPEQQTDCTIFGPHMTCSFCDKH